MITNVLPPFLWFTVYIGDNKYDAKVGPIRVSKIVVIDEVLTQLCKNITVHFLPPVVVFQQYYSDIRSGY